MSDWSELSEWVLIFVFGFICGSVWRTMGYYAQTSLIVKQTEKAATIAVHKARKKANEKQDT